MKRTLPASPLAAVSLALLLTGCGGSGGSAGTSATASADGQFLDAEVVGLELQASSGTQLTDEEGRFDYAPGETIEFRLGRTTLGEASGREVLTPIDLVPSAVDETNPRVTNISRLLQTIDDDDDPENGIVITERARNVFASVELDLGLDVLSFENDPALRDALIRLGKRGDLVSVSDARDHLRGSLTRQSAGFYMGSLDGDLDGEFVAIADVNGRVLGSVTLDGLERIAVDGEIRRDRMGAFADSEVDLQLVGMFGRRANGDWSTDVAGNSGTWSASRSLNRTAPPSAPARRLQGIYEVDLDFDLGDGSLTPIHVEVSIDADGRPELAIQVDGVNAALTTIVYTRANANAVDFAGLDDRGLLVEGTATRNGGLTILLARYPALRDSIAATGSRR